MATLIEAAMRHGSQDLRDLIAQQLDPFPFLGSIVWREIQPDSVPLGMRVRTPLPPLLDGDGNPVDLSFLDGLDD